MLAPLGLRDFRLLWTGMTVSLLGDGVFLVAIAWQVYDLSNLPSALAVVGLAMAVPQVLFLLIGGVVSDRVDRRRVMLVADVVRGAAITTIGILSLQGVLRLWHVAALAAVYGAGQAFFGPAFDAIVPDIVPPGQLGAANALDQFVRPAAFRLAGPALGGLVIYSFGVGWAFVLDGVSFVVSVTALLLMRARPIERDGAGQSAVREIREGFSYVRSQTWLWGTFAAATIAYLLFMGPTEVLLPYLVKYQLGGSSRTLGFILAFGGVGAIGGALIMGHTGIPRRFITFMYVSWTIATLAVAGYGLATLPWQAMVACLIVNGLETTGTIVWATAKHRLVPGALLGRVASFDWFISIGLVPLSFALTAPVAAAIGARATLVGAGVIGAAVTLAALFLPGMRTLEHGLPLLEERRVRRSAWVEV